MRHNPSIGVSVLMFARMCLAKGTKREKTVTPSTPATVPPITPVVGEGVPLTPPVVSIPEPPVTPPETPAAAEETPAEVIIPEPPPPAKEPPATASGEGIPSVGESIILPPVIHAGEWSEATVPVLPTTGKGRVKSSQVTEWMNLPPVAFKRTMDAIRVQGMNVAADIAEGAYNPPRGTPEAVTVTPEPAAVKVRANTPKPSAGAKTVTPNVDTRFAGYTTFFGVVCPVTMVRAVTGRDGRVTSYRVWEMKTPGSMDESDIETATDEHGTYRCEATVPASSVFGDVVAFIGERAASIRDAFYPLNRADLPSHIIVGSPVYVYDPRGGMSEIDTPRAAVVRARAGDRIEVEFITPRAKGETRWVMDANSARDILYTGNDSSVSHDARTLYSAVARAMGDNVTDDAFINVCDVIVNTMIDGVKIRKGLPLPGELPVFTIPATFPTVNPPAATPLATVNPPVTVS